MYSHGYELMGLHQQHMERARVLAAHAQAEREGNVHRVTIYRHELLPESKRVVGEEYDEQYHGHVIDLP